MWIERIDFAGFGNLAGERIEFQPNKLNLIVEPNDFGKSTIADALWSIIFDFPRTVENGDQRLMLLKDVRKPNRPNAPYLASVDLTDGRGRRLKIIRDFNDGSFQVVDRSHDNADVTEEYLSPSGQDQIGPRLAGITRDVYLSTFYTGQRKLQENPLHATGELLAVLQNVSDGSNSSGNAAIAVQVLSDSLAQFGYHAGDGKLDSLIRSLEARQVELKSRVEGLESQRKQAAAELVLLLKMKHKLREASQIELAQEYFDLCLHMADLDSQSITTSDKVGRRRELQMEIVRLSAVEEFPLDMHQQVEDLWARRNAKLQEYQNIEQQVAPEQQQFSAQQAQIRQRLGNLDGFTNEDIQNLTALTNSLMAAQFEVKELVQRRELEAVRVRDNSAIDVERVEQMRRSLNGLDAREVESAKNFDAVLNAARAQMGECQRLIKEQKGILDEIEEDKKSKKSVVFFNAAAHRKKEVDAAEATIQQQNDLIKELRAKVDNLEKRLDGLAKKAGLANAGQLLSQVHDYSSKSSAVKDIEALDQLLSTREGVLNKFKQDVKPYFDKAERGNIGITAESAKALLNDATKFIDEMRALEASFESLGQTRKQLDSIGTDINDTEGLLESIFMRSHLLNPEDLNTSYNEFVRSVELSKQLERAKKEFARLDEEESGDTVRDPAQIEAERERCMQRIQELIEMHPEIAEMSPPSPGARVALENLEMLSFDSEQRGAAYRAFMREYDETFLPLSQELDRVDYDLAHLRQARAAIELARETLQRLANETGSDWLTQVNAISRQLLTTIGLTLQAVDFTPDLRLNIRAGRNATRQLSQLSESARDQVHLFSRLVIATYLSSKVRMPIILDEVLSELDDEAFLRIMRFLIDVMAPQNQVIMFSCHLSRYQWLMQNLTNAQKQNIAICRKTVLRPDAVTS